MTFRSNLLAGVAMTASERAQGRYMRAPEGHGDGGEGGGTPAPSPAPAPSEGAADSDDFSAFEDFVAEEDDDDDSSGDNVDPATPAADDADPEDPPASDDPQGASVQERIDELTAKHREAERALAEERRLRNEERAAWEASQSKPDKKGEGEPQKEEQRPDPSKYEFGEADSKFIEDLASWKADQRFNERMEGERQEAQQREMTENFTKMEADWTSKVSADDVKTKYADFDDKVTKGADRGDWALSPVGVLVVKGSEVGPDVAYHLASNPEESRRIAGLNPFEQALELGRLEGRYLGAAKPATPPAKAVTDAPTPPENRSRGAGGKFSAQPDTEDFAAFDKMADGIIG